MKYSPLRKYTSNLKYVLKEGWRLLICVPVIELCGGDARQPRGKVDLPTVDFIRSQEYQRLMDMCVPYKCDPGRNEASTYTKSYKYRHHTCFSRLGAWRWRGMQRKALRLLPLFDQARGRIVDLGGAGCPLGLDSVVVDRLPVDKAGRPVRYKTLAEVDFQPEVIFASHVLEHIDDIHGVLREIKAKLTTNGWLVVFVPSFTNEGWRAGLHSNSRFGSHVWTFGLARQEKPASLERYLDIDVLLSSYFEVVETEDVGDDSLFVLCRNT